MKIFRIPLNNFIFDDFRANVFHCGDTDDMRMPSIYIHGNSDDEGSTFEGFTMFWSTINDGYNYINPNPGPVLEVGTVYHVELDITQNQWGFAVDGKLMFEGDKDNHETSLTVPCYASFPDEDGADAVIDNIVITPGSCPYNHRHHIIFFKPILFCLDASDLTSSPTKDPTYMPSSDPTETPTVSDNVFIGYVIERCVHFPNSVLAALPTLPMPLDPT